MLLNVPLRAQAKDNSCWNASAYMLWLYSQQKTGRQGPMATHFDAYAVADTTPLQYSQFKEFAKQVGLKSLPKKSVHSSQDLATYLQDYGPILCCGEWFGVGHAIVLTGVGESTVFFNDPDRGVKKNNTVDWWNEKLFSGFDDTLMYKDPSRY
ncbi:MAG: hypothetical protein JKY67_20245 [Pseudomonadales bacterium]|nr:hypothetical protein [Pseudomonadales bacterium]